MCRANFALFAFFVATNTRADTCADIPKPPAYSAYLRLCVEIKYEFSATAENSSAHVFKIASSVLLCLRMSARKQVYLQGETATFAVADAGYSAVRLEIAGLDAVMTAQMTLAEGRWTETYDTKGVAGPFRFAIFADDKLVEEGTFSVRVLVSKYRAIVKQIDEAIQKAATTGLSSVSVGELNISNRPFDEMQKIRASYLNLAVAEERGESADASIMPRREDLFL